MHILLIGLSLPIHSVKRSIVIVNIKILLLKQKIDFRYFFIWIVILDYESQRIFTTEVLRRESEVLETEVI